jgi:hypothetical protein
MLLAVFIGSILETSYSVCCHLPDNRGAHILGALHNAFPTLSATIRAQSRADLRAESCAPAPMRNIPTYIVFPVLAGY